MWLAKMEKFEQIAKPLYSMNKDSMHNWKHILRIKKKVALLRKDYSDLDEDKLNFIICFHGQKEWVKKNENILKVPKNYLLSLYRHAKKPITNEEKIVWDANALESVGKFGIKKALQVGRELGRSKKETSIYISDNLWKAKFYTPLGRKLGNLGIKFIKGKLKNVAC